MKISHSSLALRRTRACCALLVLASASSAFAAPPSAQLQAYAGAPAPEAEVATLRLSPGDLVRIDGRPILGKQYGSTTLRPGPHSVEWTHTFVVSSLVDTSMRVPCTAGPASVMLDAGHSYRLRSERTAGYRVSFWIEEASTGYVLWQSGSGASFMVRDRDTLVPPAGFIDGTRVLGELKAAYTREEVMRPLTDWSGLSAWRATLHSGGYSDADIVDGSEVSVNTYCYNLPGEAQQTCRHNGSYQAHVSPALLGKLTFEVEHNRRVRMRGDLVEIEFHRTPSGRLLGVVVAIYRSHADWGSCRWAFQDPAGPEAHGPDLAPFGMWIDCGALPGWSSRHVAGSPRPPADAPRRDVHEWVQLPASSAQ